MKISEQDPPAMSLTYRPVAEGDLPFLKRVYRSTREDELQLTGWDEAFKETFIDQQFTAQHQYYREAYHDASFQLILLDGKEAGRLYVWESDRQIRIVDIALLPEFRNQGIGTTILRGLITKADTSGRILSIHVEAYNPALNLYKRLGFIQKDQTGIYFYMERPPS
jgi:GNAT superfamily N-acetyltransferase